MSYSLLAEHRPLCAFRWHGRETVLQTGDRGTRLDKNRRPTSGSVPQPTVRPEGPEAISQGREPLEMVSCPSSEALEGRKSLSPLAGLDICWTDSIPGAFAPG